MSSESDLLGPKRLTKYEIIRIISVRAQQIAAGSPLFLEENEIPEGLTDPVELAKLELKRGKLPLLIERREGDKISLIDIRRLLREE
ncbi:MAG: DNA-directed RNA polymerase subunit omega [Candidatus Korarchaeota archaeon]|nr:DNA-directed RNA polymerase subunit omega [Candidatus Korarchaeota archaeon]